MGFYDDTAANANYGQLVVPEQQAQHHGPAYGAAPSSQQQQTMPMAGGYSGPLTDQRPQSGGVVAIAWIVALLTAFYMLPWAIAVTRGRSTVTSIGLINLLLGWSLIAWVISFVMSLQSHGIVAIAHAPVQIVVNSAPAQSPAAPVPAPPVVHRVPAGWYLAPDGAGQEYWNGVQWTGHRAP